MFGSKQSGKLPKRKPKTLNLEPVLACKRLTAAVVSSFILLRKVFYSSPSIVFVSVTHHKSKIAGGFCK